jgi:hypothetical protein
MTGKEE